MYEFAVNKMKLQRAIVAAGKEATEEQVKEMYVKMGGLVNKSVIVEEPIVEEPIVEEPIVEEVAEPVSKKKKR